MQEKGPDGFWALTHYNVYYNYQTRQLNNNCILSSSNIDIEMTITVPKWENIASAPIEMQQDWKSFYESLWLHEQQHNAIGQSMVSVLDREFYSARRQNSCADFAGVLASIYDQAYIEADAKNTDYDARTRHGVTEGVVLDSVARTSSQQPVAQQGSLPSNRSPIAWYWWLIGAIGLLFLLRR